MDYFSRGFTGLLLFTQIGPTLSVMAERQFFPPPEPLQLSIGNSYKIGNDLNKSGATTN